VICLCGCKRTMRAAPVPGVLVLALGVAQVADAFTGSVLPVGGRQLASPAIMRLRAERTPGPGAAASALPRRAAALAADAPGNEKKRGSQRGKGLFIIENDFPFATGRYPPRVLDLDALPEQEGSKDVYNAWGKCVQVRGQSLN